MTDADHAAFRAHGDAALIGWWHMLNGDEWPEGLPDPVPPGDGDARRLELMNEIDRLVGRRAILRVLNAGLTDQEYRDFWLGAYGGDAAARERDRLRIRAKWQAELAATAPLPAIVNANGGSS